MFVDIKKYTLTTSIDSDIGVFYNLKVFDFLKYQTLKKRNTVPSLAAELRLFIYFRSWVVCSVL